MFSVWNDIICPYPVILLESQNIGHPEGIDKSWRPYDYNIFSFRHTEYGMPIAALPLKVKQIISFLES